MKLHIGSGELEAHSKLLVESYEKVIGKSIFEHYCNSEAESGNAVRLFEAPFLVLSHGTELDPILNYGNRSALELWEMDWDTFTSTPSRLTAERGLREQREKLLEDSRQQGYSEGYIGIRISRTGRRFEIKNVRLWNVYDSNGIYHGQAAVFSEWSYI